MSDHLLAALLNQPLPRGQRCGTCVAFEVDTEYPSLGMCTAAADLRMYNRGVRASDLRMYNSSVRASDCCVYWAPSDASGLDGAGVPVASPAREECNG